MNILATDTSSQALCVAIKTDSYFESRTSEGRSLQHSEKLMPTVLELCKNAGIATKDIDLFACTRGPGSFTGLRIGMAAFKGMAYAAGKPLVSVSTMEVLASCIPCFDGAIVTVMDAKKQRWYLGAFEKQTSGKTTRLLPDTDGTEADLAQVLAPYSRVLVTGPDAKAFAPKLEALFGDKQIIVDNTSGETRARTLISCALDRFETDGPDDIGQGPVYLRKSDAEIALEEKLNDKKL